MINLPKYDVTIVNKSGTITTSQWTNFKRARKQANFLRHKNGIKVYLTRREVIKEYAN